jgi:hypothetical protein
MPDDFRHSTNDAKNSSVGIFMMVAFYGLLASVLYSVYECRSAPSCVQLPKCWFLKRHQENLVKTNNFYRISSTACTAAHAHTHPYQRIVDIICLARIHHSSRRSGLVRANVGATKNVTHTNTHPHKTSAIPSGCDCIIYFSIHTSWPDPNSPVPLTI